MRPPPTIIVLAAGASSRMRGADKLLEEVEGTPLLLRAVRAACATVPEVIVVLPDDAPARTAWLTDSPARRVTVAERAMSASIRAGIAACGAEAAMLHLADMPEIDAAAMGRMVAAWQGGSAPILQATTEDGAPGQPVIFAHELFSELLDLQGDTGARDVLRRHGADHVALPGQAARIDLDTPEAWAAWRAGR